MGRDKITTSLMLGNPCCHGYSDHLVKVREHDLGLVRNGKLFLWGRISNILWTVVDREM